MAKRQLITKEFLMQEFTQYVEKEGIVPKKREFGYTTPITKYFGSYNKFVSYCGYTPNKSGNRKISKEFFVNKLNEFVKTHNRLPKMHEFGHEPQIKNLFGTFNTFVSQCGYEPNQSASTAKSLIGERFGRLVVISKSEKIKSRQSTWNCQCDCGNIKNDIPRSQLLNGRTSSCGCKHKETFENLELRKELLVEGTFLPLLNDKPTRANKTGIRGVFFNTRRKKYVATLEFKGERHTLGYFDNLSDAAKARKKAEEEYFKPILEKYDYES